MMANRLQTMGIAALAWGACLSASRLAAAATVYAEGHADIGVNYVTAGGPRFTFRTRFDSDAQSEDPLDPTGIADQTFPAEAVAIRVRDDDPPILRERKVDEETMEVLYDYSGPEWDFLGVAQGEPIWRLSQDSEIGKPFLGIATENLTPSQWNGAIAFTLEEVVSAPIGGHISLGLTDFLGQPTVKFASADGINIDLDGPDDDSDDDFTQPVGVHDHYNWWFSKPGVYEVRLGAYGNRIGVGQVHGTGVFTFLVADDAGESLPGDYDVNGIVDGSDFLLWQRTFGSSVTAGSGADGSGNGLIDADDLDLWRTNFGAGGGSVSPAVASVPEPVSVTLLLGMCGGLRLVGIRRFADSSNS